MIDLLAVSILGNSFISYGIALCLTLGMYATFLLGYRWLSQNLELLARKIPGSYDDLLIYTTSRVSNLFGFVLSLYLGSQWIQLPELGTKLLTWALAIMITWEGIKAASGAVQFYAQQVVDAQNILSDIFSSLSIFLDKPFAVGDYINTGTAAGTVEKIGLKTTHLKSLQ